MSTITSLLKSMIEGVEKRTGRAPDTVVCGSDIRSEQIRKSLQELGRDLHVIADNEISPKNVYVTHTDDLAQFPGGGRN